MFRTILVPLDGSTFSEYALPLACRLARRTGARLTLVHVHQPFTGAFVDGALYTDYGWDAELRGAEQAQLETVRKRLAKDLMFDVRLELLDGIVVETLAGSIAAMRPDLVVMTTHGRSGLARLWLGSVADGLVRQIHVPVLLLRPHADDKQPAPASLFSRILVPLDGSVLAEEVLPPAMALGDVQVAEYTLATVIEPFMRFDTVTLRHVPSPEHEETRRRAAQAQAYLDGVATRLRGEGRSVRTGVGISQHPATAILDEAQRQDANLIAMATHGRGGLQRLRLGSVADKVLRATSTPVLLFRPPDKAAA